MASALTYHVADVFTAVPYAGNQLAIVHLENSTKLAQDQKQKIAIEFNYSETIFIRRLDSSPPEFEINIFTIQCEIPFAGHPTIGAACHVFEKLLQGADQTSTILHAKAGPIEVSYDHSEGRAQASIPHNFHLHSEWRTLQRAQTSARIQHAQRSLTSNDLANGRIDMTSIVQGMNFLLVELPNLDALSRVCVTPMDIASDEDLDKGWPATLIGSLFYTLLGGADNHVIQIRQRMIAMGLEDPATGSASSALACYLALQKGGASKSYEFELEQGVEMGRRSIIGVAVTLDKSGTAVDKVVLKGQAKHVMKGEILI